jgi:N-acetylglucosamine malate deacetylase 1
MTAAPALFGSRILVLVAHPDDEVVGAAAAIARVLRDGASVAALYLTDGCISRETLWPWRRKDHAAQVERRRTESLAAARALGIEAAGWSTRSARHLWRELAAAEAEIAAATQRFRPDQLWVPAYEGGNPDHDGLNALGQHFAETVSVLEYAEYNYFRGSAMAQTFPYPSGDEETLILTEAERSEKRALLKLYASEKGNLGYVGVERESFRRLRPYDYSRPPHPGKLWYARFQWTPFKHPRVDYTQPEEVSRAIGTYLATRI